MFVDEHRRTKPTNILFVDEPKMFVCTLCLGGRGGFVKGANGCCLFRSFFFVFLFLKKYSKADVHIALRDRSCFLT